MAILSKIKSPKDLEHLTVEQLQVLASEIREKIINTCAQTGGPGMLATKPTLRN
jgi:1-deoxy-D-xylulose-5-phosphate synthase